MVGLEADGGSLAAVCLGADGETLEAVDLESARWSADYRAGASGRHRSEVLTWCGSRALDSREDKVLGSSK